MKALICFLCLNLFADVYGGDIAAAAPAPGKSSETSPKSPPIASQTPSNPQSSFEFPSALQVGRELERVGDIDGAIISYRKALSSPDPALRSIALDLITKAIPKKQAKEEIEDPIRQYLDIGKAWNDQGRIDEAIVAYDKALASKSEKARTDAKTELSQLIKKKTIWWREYFTSPLFALLMALWHPGFIGLVVVAALLLGRYCIHRSDLLLVPNPTLPDTQWLEILIRDYDRQAKQIHGFPNAKSSVSLITFGSAGELFVDLLSHVTKVESGLWRQHVVRFLQRPRFELQLSLPPSNQGGIVTATLSSGGHLKHSLIEQFSVNDFPAIQKDLAFWVAYHMRQPLEA